MKAVAMAKRSPLMCAGRPELTIHVASTMRRANNTLHLSGWWGWPTRPGRGKLPEGTARAGRLCLESPQVNVER